MEVQDKVSADKQRQSKRWIIASWREIIPQDEHVIARRRSVEAIAHLFRLFVHEKAFNENEWEMVLTCIHPDAVSTKWRRGGEEL